MQLFYAESRGLDPANARALLLEAFVMGLWDGIENAAQHEVMVTAAKDALRRVV
jgi:Fe-S cluster assembly protein SufD